MLLSSPPPSPRAVPLAVALARARPDRRRRPARQRDGRRAAACCSSSSSSAACSPRGARALIALRDRRAPERGRAARRRPRAGDRAWRPSWSSPRSASGAVGDARRRLHGHATAHAAQRTRTACCSTNSGNRWMWWKEAAGALVGPAGRGLGRRVVPGHPRALPRGAAARPAAALRAAAVAGRDGPGRLPARRRRRCWRCSPRRSRGCGAALGRRARPLPRRRGGAARGRRRLGRPRLLRLGLGHPRGHAARAPAASASSPRGPTSAPARGRRAVGDRCCAACCRLRAARVSVASCPRSPQTGRRRRSSPRARGATPSQLAATPPRKAAYASRLNPLAVRAAVRGGRRSPSGAGAGRGAAARCCARSSASPYDVDGVDRARAHRGAARRPGRDARRSTPGAGPRPDRPGGDEPRRRRAHEPRLPDGVVDGVRLAAADAGAGDAVGVTSGTPLFDGVARWAGPHLN